MALYAIGDMHLALGKDKPMDIFGEQWENHAEKLRAGFSALSDEDICVICGDLSWGMGIEDTLEDFKFIDSLPGKKIILKGNHDYWWTTASKAKKFFAENGITTIDILHNNFFEYGAYAICGTRGWFFEEDKKGSHDEKVFLRELGRLEASLAAAGDKEKICFLHYPPLYQGYRCEEILRLLRQYRVKRCCYGHLHGPAHALRIEGDCGETEFSLVSADYLKFIPKKCMINSLYFVLERLTFQDTVGIIEHNL